jgi:LuxR family transcriptional regulator, maltose regulon positive regulatory protein
MPAAGGHVRPLGPISVRKERRRQGWLWYAYRRANGQLHKVYVGTSQALTIARLDDVAADLNGRW